jgi:putative oxidoreductase
MDLIQKLTKTTDTWIPTIARITLGIVMLPHGLQKTFGMFGGFGFDATMGFLTGTMGLPTVIAFLTILAESAGALGLIVGLFSRLAALGIFSVMMGAVLTVHSHVGFFMNWDGKSGGEGFEYHLLALGLAVIVMIAGGGKASIDQAISKSK